MNEQLVERLETVEGAFVELEKELADPELIADQDRYTQAARRHAQMRPVVKGFHEYMAAMTEAADAEELAAEEADEAMAAELRQLASEHREEAADLELELKLALVPKDPNDDKNVIIEVRSAAGGDEAAIWAGDVSRMYQKYAETRGWGVEPLDASESESGGFKEISFAIKGDGAYSRLKYEAGVHRVQRIPKTESQGRVHTSTATVAVLPEVEPVEVDLDLNDVRVDVYRSSGPGGQSVNTTDSAVRLTHEPSGIVVSVQDEKSQLQNKDKAFRLLRARLYQQQLAEQQGGIAESRRAQVGSGERSEKIRTYNYKENRVTDHRIGLTIKRLPEILEGHLDGFIEALTEEEQARRLAAGS